MSLRGTAALAVLLSLASTATPALACRGECYDRVRDPDVYRTVDRPVIVRPGYREVVETEPVVVMRSERVMVQPGRVDYVMTPPVTRTVLQEIVVRRGGYRWASTYGPYGERRCKVPVPAEVKVVPREVVVAPGRRVRMVSPPVYAVRQRALAVRPAQRIVYDYPPVVARERARVLVRRGGSAWVRARY
jgi:hypothetical protein